MKLPKALLGAILLGVTLQTTSCEAEDEASPEQEQAAKEKTTKTTSDPCPACGMG
ncbi:hypothetical protein [Pedobacter sp. SYSU D00535]|uniref:chryseobasin-related MNIO class RiPP peptide n=1 Tax=Pedobacter sp. SYSU D00535 TaxID=2810308 RepID=UPI001A974B72|nr:hypothetical protein [Pedobacter sp. SYSU D00535]